MGLDENVNIIGYADDFGVARDLNGNVIGKVDEHGNVITEEYYERTGNAFVRTADIRFQPNKKYYTKEIPVIDDFKIWSAPVVPTE